VLACVCDCNAPRCSTTWYGVMSILMCVGCRGTYPIRKRIAELLLSRFQTDRTSSLDRMLNDTPARSGSSNTSPMAAKHYTCMQKRWVVVVAAVVLQQRIASSQYASIEATRAYQLFPKQRQVALLWYRDVPATALGVVLRCTTPVRTNRIIKLLLACW
jgi:hypothetical protein